MAISTSGSTIALVRGDEVEIYNASSGLLLGVATGCTPVATGLVVDDNYVYVATSVMRSVPLLSTISSVNNTGGIWKIDVLNVSNKVLQSNEVISGSNPTHLTLANGSLYSSWNCPNTTRAHDEVYDAGGYPVHDLHLVCNARTYAIPSGTNYSWVDAVCTHGYFNSAPPPPSVNQLAFPIPNGTDSYRRTLECFGLTVDCLTDTTGTRIVTSSDFRDDWFPSDTVYGRPDPVYTRGGDGGFLRGAEVSFTTINDYNYNAATQNTSYSGRRTWNVRYFTNNNQPFPCKADGSSVDPLGGIVMFPVDTWTNVWPYYDPFTEPIVMNNYQRPNGSMALWSLSWYNTTVYNEPITPVTQTRSIRGKNFKLLAVDNVGMIAYAATFDEHIQRYNISSETRTSEVNMSAVVTSLQLLDNVLLCRTETGVVMLNHTTLSTILSVNAGNVSHAMSVAMHVL
jgi:hypothetical protein